MIQKTIKCSHVAPLLGAYNKLIARGPGEPPRMRSRNASAIARSILNLQSEWDRVEKVRISILNDGLGESGTELRAEQDKRLQELLDEPCVVTVAQISIPEMHTDNVMLDPEPLVVLHYHELVQE